MYSYLALGDSYTIGEAVPSNENFPHQTARLLRERHIEVSDPVIVAVTGWTTDELAAAIRERSIKESFSFVTLLIGVNNQYRGRSLKNYKEEFTSLLNQAVVFADGHARHVFVVSIPDWGVTPFAEGRDRQVIAKEIDQYNAAAHEIALTHRCNWTNITDSTRENGKNPSFLAEDGLHPSGIEYGIWAKRLVPQIAAVLKH